MKVKYFYNGLRHVRGNNKHATTRHTKKTRKKRTSKKMSHEEFAMERNNGRRVTYQEKSSC